MSEPRASGGDEVPADRHGRWFMGAHAVTASLLRASARGFAGLAATRMFEEAPGLVEAAGFGAWQEYLSRQVLALASAVEDEAPELFSAGGRARPKVSPRRQRHSCRSAVIGFICAARRAG